jgi:replication factor C small subunit
MDHIIWTEKYRPRTFAELKGQKEIVKRLEAFVKNMNMPHVLFAGPAGVGKSTLALVVARELYKDSWRDNFLELNASDERGIDVVRIKVKDFARTKPIADMPFKIIFLDECDALTREAQQALRRTMENYTKTCRFILSCNYSSKIIDPIQSRCVVFKFKPLEKKDVFHLIDDISKDQKFHVDEKTKDALYDVSEGDLRKVANILQSCAAVTDRITEETVYSVASQAMPKEITEILHDALAMNILESRKKLLNVMLEKGLSGIDIIKQIQGVVWKLDADNHKKLEILKLCGEIEFRMVEGSDEYIQLEALLAGISLLNKYAGK